MIWIPLIVAAAVLLPEPLQAATLEPCRLRGVEHDALCGKVSRALDPSRPDGVTIDVHFAVLPALARNKRPDPVFFLAGGPGQSAMDLAGPMSRLFSRVLNRRDVVLVDQRGTGRSAPLVCDAPEATRPMRDFIEPAQQRESLRRCLAKLQSLPHGDLRYYTTTIAMADLDAVRQAIGAERINLVGGSYGTRAALEYQRQFPDAVRRTVIDGVAPPDMVLPLSVSGDSQAVLDALFLTCEQEAPCAQRYPNLRKQWASLLASLPRTVGVPHPVTGDLEQLPLTQDMLMSLMRLPLYMPRLASALPAAIAEAASGRFAPLFGVASAMVGRRSASDMAGGMHFSVICAEDYPRLSLSGDRPGEDFGESFARVYRDVCSQWPIGQVPAGFYEIPPARSATLVLSGGIDPVTPPRHGERTAKALGAKARHVVVAHAGHGVMGIGCMRDLMYRFIDAAEEAEALAFDAGCVESIPRPLTFLPVRAPREAAR